MVFTKISNNLKHSIMKFSTQDCVFNPSLLSCRFRVTQMFIIPCYNIFCRQLQYSFPSKYRASSLYDTDTEHHPVSKTGDNAEVV